MRHRRGYILLTVLLLLMLAAVVMASICRLAIRTSLEASSATDELQRRWGTISCREAFLPKAENLLEMAETPPIVVGRVHADFLLGAEQFSVDICDEQAKANVNALFAIQGKDRAEQSIRTLVRAAGGNLTPTLRLTAARDLRIQHAPPTKMQSPQDDAGLTSAEHISPVFGSWSEIFPEAQETDLLPGRPGAVTNNLTCWGNGSLNLRRASIASLTQVCSPVLSPQQIVQLLAVRERLGDSATVDQLVSSLHMETSASATISERLTTISATQSLWICTRDHSASQCSLIVRDGSNSDDVRDFSFRW